MWTPGPFEARPLRAFYYITDVDPSWPPERQDEHLRDFNYGALWSISIHEVFPGHFLHYQHLRQVDSKLRKSILFSSTAFVEGWAHYCEQMMIEEGFRRERSRRPPRAARRGAIRLCRFIVGIRLHCEDMSVEQGVRFFRDEAFLEEASARREAERGTFDPSYILYSAGKLMLLKLREDYKAQRRREVLAARIPRHAARQRHGAALAAPRAACSANRTARCSNSARCHAALRIPVRVVRARASSGSRSSRIRRSTPARPAAGPVRKLLSSPAIQFKGSGWYITDYAKKSATMPAATGERKTSSSESKSDRVGRATRSRRSRHGSTSTPRADSTSTEVDVARRPATRSCASKRTASNSAPS